MPLSPLAQIDNALSAWLPLVVTADQTTHSSTTANSSLQEELEVLFEESAALANRLKKNARLLHRNDNLSASGRGLLQTLNLHGSMTVPQLAAARSTSRQNIQVLADRLAEAGFISFVSNPEHKRSVLVALTEAGRTLLSSANEREATLLENLPQTASTQLREATELLRKLRFQLGGEPKRRRAKNEATVTIATETTTTETAKPAPKPKPTAKQPEPVDDDELPVSLL